MHLAMYYITWKVLEKSQNIEKGSKTFEMFMRAQVMKHDCYGSSS